MKKLFALFTIAALSIASLSSSAQNDKSKRKSPPVTASQELKSGAKLTINYSQPSVNGREIGKNLEPMPGKVWRAGANEATTFETSKDVKIEGKTLAAGKYAVFMIDNGDSWDIIFNKKYDTWGAYDYEKNKGENALIVKVKPSKAAAASEKLTYTIDPNGTVTMLWGDRKVAFAVK